jgi:hypothetical protein
MIGTPFPVGAGPRFFDTTVSCFGIKTLISQFPFLRKRWGLTHKTELEKIRCRTLLFGQPPKVAPKLAG